MNQLACLLTFLFCFASIGGVNAHAVETWADTKLPVKEALELWFDASREPAAREAAGLSPLSSGAGLDFWHDASGHAHHLNQRLRDARPQFQKLAGTAFLRFDGENDFLSGSAIPRVTLTNATVFVFTAPASNAGGFRGLIAWNRAGSSDYKTGFNIDLGSGSSTNWNKINVEGSGAPGERNLLTSSAPFESFHTVAITTEPGERQTRLHLDGVGQGARSRVASGLVMEELTVGGRHNDTAGATPHTQGFFAGDIAEVLVYDRALGDSERREVEGYLAKKYAGLLRALNDPTVPLEKPLVIVSNPPPVQMLVPGFLVRALPLQLNNINNLVYAPDGRLFALGYDGNVFQLKDTDGDGLEDTASYFFKNDRNEIPACIGMAWGPGGLYIPAKGRIIRLRDTGDGTAQLETIASGWVPPSKFGGSSLDAVAIAVDKEGTVFFGMGCDDWTGAYRVNKSGASDYNIQSERGTILKLSADGKKREIVATGLRWPSSLAFNDAGDLFCTDQEGATWLPNGNPFDELLHIQPGRHYGFPPRHPKYLPEVIDEPSVFDYAPQHESTCGLHFNDGGKIFGPDWWKGDALIAGESRGKIWRTKLVKTAGGYIAQNQIIACLNMLTLDSIPSPDGDLVVTCHSGQPDWGTGPQGKGKLFKISYTDRVAAQPVLAYAASPTETRVLFDRPLAPGQMKGLAARSRVTMGKYVTAGDRFESFRPGYQVVANQMIEPHYELRILSAGVSGDGRSISLQTAPRAMALNYGVTLPESGQDAPSSYVVAAAGGFASRHHKAAGALPQHASIDLACGLTGVEAIWRDADGKEQWSGWLPHLDLTVARAFTGASEEHGTLFKLLKQPGALQLRTQLDLWQMLRAATQAGSKLDFEYPPETVTLTFKSSGGLKLRASSAAKIDRATDHEARIIVESKKDGWLRVELTLATGAREPELGLAWQTAEDARPRALHLRRLLLPWATPPLDSSLMTERKIPEIAGGNWNDGKKIFFSDQAACYKCHQVGGEGGKLGPDLSNLIHRDYASVLKDIAQPSAAINPDHLAYNIELNDGELVNGVILNDNATETVVGLASGAPMNIPKSRIKNVKASALSLMPENLLQGLDAQQHKDLLTFLLMAKP